MKILENLMSKKLWVAVIALLSYLVDKDPNQAWPLAIIAAVYVAAQAYVDGAKARNGE